MEGSPVQRRDILEVSDLLIRFLQSGEAYGNATPYASGLSPTALRATIRLAVAERSTISDVASALGVSSSWASRAVDELVRAGLAERTRAAHDRRVVEVRLTGDASKWVDDVLRTHGAKVARALADLSPTEREAVQRFLRALLDDGTPRAALVADDHTADG